jgi:hypothetical protein
MQLINEGTVASKRIRFRIRFRFRFCHYPLPSLFNICRILAKMARKGQETESVALDDLSGLPSALSLARSLELPR